MSDETTKEALKEALKEWMDAKLSDFGWWSLKAIGAMMLAGAVWLSLMASGWHK